MEDQEARYLEEVRNGHLPSKRYWEQAQVLSGALLGIVAGFLV